MMKQHKTMYTLKFKNGTYEHFRTLEAAREALDCYEWGSCWIIGPLYEVQP
jgi:hypothetical protein